MYSDDAFIILVHVKQQTALGCLHPILIQSHVRKPNPNIPPLFEHLALCTCECSIHPETSMNPNIELRETFNRESQALLEITVSRKCFVTSNEYGSIVTAAMIVKKHERLQHLSCLWDTTESITHTLLWKCAVLKCLQALSACESMAVLQPCRLTDGIRLNTAGQKR